MATDKELFYPYDLSKVSEWPGTRPAGWAPHWGTDFAVPTGTVVRATSNGTIVYVGDDGLGGMTIDLLRPDGLLQRFGHLSRYLVSYGQKVVAGQNIALSGNTGASTGPHLHWELRWDRAWSWGAWADPRRLGAKSFSQLNPTTPSTKPGGGATTSKRRKKSKMDYASVSYKKANGNQHVKIFCLGNGQEHNYEVADMSYIKNIAATYQCGIHSIITKSHFDAITRELAATRKMLGAK